ncbi:MXAN_5187 family protein [Archangium lipolyticum]|uniref:MXAN_5187 family protein n=1 Tax=Archangium lipolyticum TaxID=2970465 RepID=UPI00214A3C23|nr:MXAN_5187 family protein [Archangium lipolyticum]
MVRFKFFLFALLVLGLGLAHLPLLSGPLSAQAVDGASAPTLAAISEVARALEARRLVVQGLALKLAASPDVASAVQPQVVPLPRGKGIRIVEPPVAERFTGLRSSAQGLVPEALKGSIVLALATNDGSLYARADGEPASDDTLNVQELLKAGSEGVVVDAFDAAHVFFAVPVLWNAEGGRSQVAATVLVGAPLVVDEKALESAAHSSGVAALAVVKGDKVLGSAGSQKALADEALEKLQAGQVGHVVQRGGVRGLIAQLPQVKLPLLTQPDDFKGGEAPLAVGSRKALDGGYEVVAVSSVRPFMSALADYQQNALYGLVGLLGFSLVWTLVMGSGQSASAAAPAKKEEKKKKKGKKGQEEEASEPAPAPVAAALPVQATPEPPVPGPDDFPFPAAPAAARPVQAEPAPAGDAFPFPPPPAPGADPYAAQAPAADAFPFPPAPVSGNDPFAARPGADAFPFPSADAPPAPGVASAAAPRGAFAFEDQPTAAYSLQQAADPFAAAAAQAGLPSSGFGDEDAPPERTRVAAIPQELLARAARPATTEIPVQRAPGHPGVAAPSLAPTPVMGTPMGGMATPPPPPPPSGAIAWSEEQHFQDVFREFVATREQCSEPNDGLTYDKFVAKLRKNKEQLVQKYACKTVRFQVYVKEGKAALKATPVKD